MFRYQEVFEPTSHEHVKDAIEHARDLERTGSCITEYQGSGPSKKFFIFYEGEYFHAKATLRYAMRLAGIDTSNLSKHDFTAHNARDWLKKLGFKVAEITKNEIEALKIVNRDIRLAKIRTRPGQAIFRNSVLALFGNRCAISGCDVVDALEAAHIVSVKEDGLDDPNNGISLRSDIHRLFDIGLLTIDATTLKVNVGKKLKNSYGIYNGVIITPINQKDKTRNFLQIRANILTQR